MADSKVAVAQRPAFGLSIKLSRRFWLILGTGLLVLLAILLWYLRSQQVAEEKSLNEELDLANGRLASLELDQIVAQQEQVRSQIASTEAETQALLATLGGPADSIVASDTLYRIARECGVTIGSISASEVQTTAYAGTLCQSVSVALSADGNWPALLKFVSTLKTGFTNSLVENATFSGGGSTSEASVNVKLMVYSIEGETR